MFSKFSMRWILVLSMLILSGCPPSPPSLPEGYLLPQKQPRGPAISNRVLLVADNQLHNVYGDPVGILRSGLADKLVHTAIRPIQLDFYGQDLLDWLVKSRGTRMPIVHIGDACNFSCTGEFIKFQAIMQNAIRGWAMAPGNHDGFFFGNAERDSESGDWPAACRNAGRPMTKDLFVRFYLAALVQQKGASYQDLARQMGLDIDALPSMAFDQIAMHVPPSGDWRYQGQDGTSMPFLRAVSWRIDPNNRWRSFVVQEVDLTLDRSLHPAAKPTKLILLDTSQYAAPPRLVPTGVTVNAGVTGELLSDQLHIVDAWIEPAVQQERVWVLVGHHPFDSLRTSTRAAVDRIRKRANAALYVSAHTHAGQFIVHAQNEKETWLELNVGSILDWSLEFRTLQFFQTPGDGRLAMRSPRNTMHEWLREFEGVPANAEVWEAKPGEADFYLSHNELADADAEKTEDRLKSALLAAHHRLLRVNPTVADAPPDAPFWPLCCNNDAAVLAEIERLRGLPVGRLQEKIAFLIALDRFEQARPVAQPDKRRKFRLSQALWASKYDSVRSRKPLVDDLFIIFPE